MRLLSFLDSVETALRADGHDLSPAQVSRQVDYGSGLARMELPDGLSLMVQNFNMADGQFCLKAWWENADGTRAEVRAFFDANGTDWKSAARQMAANKPEGIEAQAVGGDSDGVADDGGYRSAV